MRGSGREIARPDTVYWASVVSGLEDVAAADICLRLPGARVLERWRGRVFFAYPGPPAEVLKLRAVEHVFAMVRRFSGLPAEESGLAVVEEELYRTELGEALRVLEAVRGRVPWPKFRVTATRSGEHAYNSQQVAAAAGSGVQRRYGWPVDLTRFDVDVRVDVVDGECLVGVRLSEMALHRRSRLVHAPASLNPTVAYAMAWLTRPGPEDVVVDPTCGAGTTLIERATIGRFGLLVGGDLFADAVAMAAVNTRAAHVPVWLFQWDARRLPLKGDSVDVVLANLPWGRRVASHQINRRIYRRIADEIARVLRDRGRAAILTLERRLVSEVYGRHRELYIAHARRLSYGGLEPSLYIIKPRGR